MVLRLAERLDVPLRERNVSTDCGGVCADVFRSPALGSGVELCACGGRSILTGHEPYPALLVDRHWTLIASNKAVGPMLAGIDPSLLAPPANVLRATLHPKGFAPRIENLAQWRAHVLARVARDLELTADLCSRSCCKSCARTLSTVSTPSEDHAELQFPGVVIPIRLRTEAGVLSMFSTTTVFGTAVEVTLSELVLEAFYPADEATAGHSAQSRCRELINAGGSQPFKASGRPSGCGLRRVARSAADAQALQQRA